MIFFFKFREKYEKKVDNKFTEDYTKEMLRFCAENATYLLEFQMPPRCALRYALRAHVTASFSFARSRDSTYFGPAAPAAVAPCGVGGLGFAESEYVVAFCMQKSASAGL